jgi:hypothetical protein
MKVKIGETIYDSVEQPIVVILSEADKRNIAGMSPTATKYCAGPDTMSDEDLYEFCETEEDLECPFPE